MNFQQDKTRQNSYSDSKAKCDYKLPILLQFHKRLLY